MRNWYSAQELAGLPGMPASVSGLIRLAKRQDWASQARAGKGGGREYAFSCLPPETQAALIAAQINQAQPTEQPQPEQPAASTLPVIAERDMIPASRLTDDQRSVMTARLAFVREIERMRSAVTQQRAIETLVELARNGELSPYLAERVVRANDRKTEDRSLSERTLKRWLSDYRQHGETGLAPARRQKDTSVPDWAADFLRCYQRPTKPSVEAAYAEFAAKHPDARPSIHAVRRFLNKLSPEARERGRYSPQELRAFQAFRRRTTKNLWPGDVYTADGHKFDAEVLNPRTGKPYRPEVTTVLDVATRRVLGISVSEAENAIFVLDALRDAVRRGGMFVIFYVDNGSGFANDMVREVVDRLGGTMTHALPYNSQARGLIERAHQSIWVNAAKKLPSYIGADMDKHAGTKVHRISRKQLREAGQTVLIPTFAEFMAGVEFEIEAYNHRPHRGLARVRDRETGQLRHMSPMEAWEAARGEGWEPLLAPAELVDDLFRPQIVRKTTNGEVAWASQKYFLKDLVALHGEEVRLAYDVRDASRVWVRTLEGELLGEALIEGNASDYMPKSLIERGYEKREQGQFKLAVDKVERLTGKRVELIAPSSAPADEMTQEQLTAAVRRVAAQIEEEENRFQIPEDSVERYRLWQRLDARVQGGEALNEAEARWHARYPTVPEYRLMKETFEAAPLQLGRA